MLRGSVALVALLLVALPSSAAFAEPGHPRASAAPALCRLLDETLVLEFGSWGGAGTLRREQFAAAGSAGAARGGGWVIYGAATPTRAETDRGCRRAARWPAPSKRALTGAYRYRRTSEGATYFRTPEGERLIGDRLHRRSIDVIASRLAFGVGFACLRRGPVLVRVTDVRSGGRTVGSRLVVGVRTEVVAEAVVRDAGESFFRVARDCRLR